MGGADTLCRLHEVSHQHEVQCKACSSNSKGTQCTVGANGYQMAYFGTSEGRRWIFTLFMNGGTLTLSSHNLCEKGQDQEAILVELTVYGKPPNTMAEGLQWVCSQGRIYSLAGQPLSRPIHPLGCHPRPNGLESSSQAAGVGFRTVGWHSLFKSVHT